MYRLQLYVPGFDPEEPLGTEYETYEEAQQALATLKQALKIALRHEAARFTYEIVS